MHFNPDQAREKIMQSYINPVNKIDLKNENNKITKFSSSCSDKLELIFNIENDVLIDAKFDAQGCAIFLASTDILISQIKNKKIKEIKEIIKIFKQFVNQEIELTQQQKELIGDLWVFFNVKKHLNRLTCALLCADIFEEKL